MKHRIQSLLTLFCILLLTLCARVAFADYVVIVNPNNASEFTDTDIRRIFLIKVKEFPNGQIAHPIDRPEGFEIRTKFVRDYIGTSESQFKRYLVRLLFTGKAVLPKVLETDEEVVKAVATYPNTIGFVDSEAVDGRVRIVARF